MNRELVALLLMLLAAIGLGIGLGIWIHPGAGISATCLVMLWLGYQLALQPEGEEKER